MNQATLDFIRKHARTDVRQLALQGTRDPEIDLSFALEQIAGWQKARTKLPSWAAVEGMLYPPHLSMEQCSSEQTARYKASLAGEGSLLVDLTGGFGVDFSFMARGYQKAVYVERQPHLCAIAKQNLVTLGLTHAEVKNADGMAFLHSIDHADLLFIDPARRDEHGGRTYGIADCTPNVLENLDEMLKKADRVMIKLSPMLDWQKAVADVRHVNEVHIVSVDNECKELLVEVRKGEGEKERKYKVVCVNLLHDDTREVFEFEAPLTPSPSHLLPFSPPHRLTSSPSHPLTFLYEPNASIMKAGCFELLEQRFGAVQLDRNSHLYVSDKEIPDFPGRQFVIEGRSSMNKRDLKLALSGITKANITVRNFPISVAELRKRLKLKDGGDLFIFATTVADGGHQLFICRKVR